MITNLNLANNLTEYLNAIINSSADYIIFREKNLTDYQAEQLIREILKFIKKEQLIVNYHLQVALKLGINNIHLSFQQYQQQNQQLIDLKAKNQQLMIGVSIHNQFEASNINQAIINYVLIGTIFATKCKPGCKLLSLIELNQLCDFLIVPVIVVGGINSHNIHQLNFSKISGYAQMSKYYQLENH